MDIIKNTVVTVESFIEELGDSGLAESSERCTNEYPALLKLTDTGLTLSYTEESEGGRINAEISSTAIGFTVRRSGAIESEFEFIEGEATASLYKIPPYSFDAEIYTRKIRNNLTRGIGNLTILYDMTVGGAKKSVRMRICVQEVSQ